MRSVLTLALLAASAAIAVPAQAQEAAPGDRAAGDVLVRLRAIDVAPNESSGQVTGIAGSSVGVSDSVMPELDFTYMVTDHVGAELILGTTKHNITGRGTIGGLGKIADTWVLPPTLTLQYHFMPKGMIHPYVGAGVNYTIFYSSGTTSSLDNALGKTHFGLKDSVGYALQAGLDVDVAPKFFINADLKYIGMKTRGYLHSGSAGTLRTVHVDLDPLVASVGVGYKF